MNEASNQNDYADRDIRLKPILVFIIVSLLVTVASVVGLKILFNQYEAEQSAQLLAATDRIIEASRPTNAVVEGLGEAAIAMKQLRAEEDAKLNHYVLLDAASGAVQIPVDRAMEIVVQKSMLPHRKME